MFFTSRMVDSFNIFSGGVNFNHDYGDTEDWIFERGNPQDGTVVYLNVNNHTSRTPKKVFDQYSSAENYGFTKTVVPVRMAQYGTDKLVSRSQAKRVLARVELFKTVLFDFREVPIIGQAFADELLRHYAENLRVLADPNEACGTATAQQNSIVPVSAFRLRPYFSDFSEVHGSNSRLELEKSAVCRHLVERGLKEVVIRPIDDEGFRI